MNGPIYFVVRFDPSQAEDGGGVYVEHCGTSARSAANKIYGPADENGGATLHFYRWTAVDGLKKIDDVNNFSASSVSPVTLAAMHQLLEASIRYCVMHMLKGDSKIAPGSSLN